MKYLVAIFLLLSGCAKDLPKLNCDLTPNSTYVVPTMDLTTQSVLTYYGDSQYNCVPVTVGYQPYSYHIIQQVKLTNIKAGDSIQVLYSGEVTNEFSIPAMVGAFIKVSSDPLSAGPNTNMDPNLVALTRPTGYNLSYEMHHGEVNRFGVFTLNSVYSELYISVVLYSANGKKASSLTVERNYGTLSVTKLN